MSAKTEDHVHKPTERMLHLEAEHEIRHRGETATGKRREAFLYSGDTQCAKKVRVDKEVVRLCHFVAGHVGSHATRDGVTWNDEN